MWCGFCQRLAPFFDGAAKHFNDVGGLVLAKVNCADPSNGDLCGDLGLTGYPSFYYGAPGEFGDIRSNPPAELNELRSMSSAEEMISLLSKRFSIDGPTTEPVSPDDDVPPNGINETDAPLFTIGVDAYLSDIEKSTSESLVQALVSTRLIAKDGAREAFYDWQTWLADSHPSEKCRKGAQDILDDLDNLWPVDNSPGIVRSNLMKKNQCLTDYTGVEYKGCAVGVNPSGYTCGLWQTFHSMSVSPTTLLTGAQMFQYLEQFITYFFTCTICQEHFLGLMDKANQSAVSTQDGFIIWLWEAHNEANARLREEEINDGTFNVDRPKGLFPSPELCPKCLDDLYFEEHGSVLSFLEVFYGQDLVSGAEVSVRVLRGEDDSSSSRPRFGRALATSILIVTSLYAT